MGNLGLRAKVIYMLFNYTFLLFITIYSSILFVPSIALGEIQFPLVGPSGETVLGFGTCETTAFSPDGKYISTGGSLGAFLWNIQTGVLLDHFSSDDQPINLIQISHQGNLLLFGSTNTANLWNIDTHQLVCSFTGYTNGINALAFSPDDSIAVIATKDQADLWDINRSQKVQTLRYQYKDPNGTLMNFGTITDMVFSLDSKKLYISHAYYEQPITLSVVNVWDVDTGKLENILRYSINTINSLTISRDGNYLILGTVDEITILKLGTEASLTIKNGGAGVDISPDGKSIIACTGWMGKVQILDFMTGNVLQSITLPGKFLSVKFLPDGRPVLLYSDNFSIKLMNFENEQDIVSILGHITDIRTAVYSPDSKHILCGGTDGIIREWDVDTGTLIHYFNQYNSITNSVDYSPDGKWAIAGSDHSIQLWNMETGKEAWSKGESANSVCISPNGLRALTAGNDNSAKVWDLLTGENLITLHGEWPIKTAFFSNKNDNIITVDLNFVKLWDIDTGWQLSSFQTGYPTSAAIAPDGNQLLIGGGVAYPSPYNRGILYDISTKNIVHEFLGHASRINSVDISPDGKWILTGSTDRTAKLWNRQTGQEIRTFIGHKNEVSVVSFSPNGNKVMTGCLDGTLRIWDITDSITHVNHWSLY